MSKIYISPEQVALQVVTRKLHITFEPYELQNIMYIELSEDALLQVANKVVGEYNVAFKEHTGRPGNLNNVSKVVIKIGDYELKAEEEFEAKTIYKSNGFKKVEQ